VIENRDESRDIAAHFRQNEPPHRQVVAVSWSVYRGTSYISQLERYIPHAQLVETERKLADAIDERNGALHTILQAKEALESGVEEHALHILEGNIATEEVIDLRQNVDKLTDEVSVLRSRVTGLRAGLEDIRSLRRIGDLSDVSKECDFYLGRDTE